MKATELRIGNWIWNDVQKIPVKVDLKILSEQLFREPMVNRGKLDKSVLWNPLPLTEEILLRFGFEKWGSLYKIKLGRVGVFAISINDFSFGLYFSESSFRAGSSYTNDHRIKYVHQLQNLFFALTGEELKMEDK